MKAKAIFLNKRILLSLGMLFVIGALIATATGAFYNDVETSTGNTFTAGEIDLKIDNHAWYNGIECKFYAGSGPLEEQPEGWYWTDEEGNSQGDSYLESLLDQPCQSSWELKDLESGDLFFNFDDLKAGDWEEDTISLHVTNNDAWVCVDMELTSDDDVNTVEPELEAGDTEDDDTDNWDGELGEALHFIFWADDGDNVLEVGEEIVASGTPAEELPSGDDNGGRSFPIVDSTTNLFGVAGEPFVPGTTWYIGKAFCYGDIVPNPVAQGDNSPAINPGFDCDGSTVSNQTQTDSLVGNISFTAVQSRNNGDFVCARQDDGGEEQAIEFVLTNQDGEHDDNEANGEPYVTWVINGDEIEFTFHNPTAIGSPFPFEYRIDDEAGAPIGGITGVEIPSGPYAGNFWGDFYNFESVGPGSSSTITLTGSSKIQVRLVIGPERDYDFEWITFEAQPVI